MVMTKEEKKLDSFKWRVWNTFKSATIAIGIAFSGSFLFELQKESSVNCLLDIEFWKRVAFAFLIAIMGSIVAGFDKINRMK